MTDQFCIWANPDCWTASSKNFANLFLFVSSARYVTGTEVVHPTEEPVPRMEGLDDEILVTLREIRDILRKKGSDKSP